MPVEWSGLGPELLIVIDRDNGIGLRSQLEDQLREGIRRGRLAGHERLPSSRELANTLGLSRGLVQDCYAQLQAEGYLTSHPGSATRVAAGAASRPAPPPKPNHPVQPRHAIADFRHGVPDLRLAPREDWAWAIREVCRTAPNTAFDYGDPLGEPRLRDVLAAYLRRVRAVAATGGQVVICTGMAQALGLVLRALAATGVDTFAFEDPGASRSAVEQATTVGMTTAPVPVDEDGIDVAALDRVQARTAVLVTPAHQWPTGVVLAGHRRQELIAWARRHDGVIIEDDYDAEFRYDRDPVGSLHGLAPDRVISLGTVSKSLAPALRLGWLIAPDNLLDALAHGKQVADRGSPGLDQLALATLIESGRYDRHLRRARTEYAARRETLVGALATHAPARRVTGLAAGFHAILHLSPDADEDELINQAGERGVGLYGMARMHHSGRSAAPRLVLGFGDTTQPAIRAGIAAVADLLRAT